MGLADRDYMRERRHGDRPFTPPEPSFRTTIGHVLVWVVIAFLTYKAVAWWQSRPSPRQLAPSIAAPVPAQQPPAPAPVRTHPGLTGNWDPNRPVPTYAPHPSPPAPAEVVTKCTVNGVTTYSNGPCPEGVNATRVTIHPTQNLADGLPASQRQAPVAPQAPQFQPDVQASAGGPPTEIQNRRVVCAELDAAIATIDARARQPLPGFEQDRLAAQRKSYRDEQFRIRC